MKQTGYNIEEIRQYVADHPELQLPLQKIPKNEEVIGGGANFVLHVGKQMKADRSWQRATVSQAEVA